MSVLRALEDVIDQFAREGGLTPSNHKNTRPNQFNAEPDVFYQWATTTGVHFKAAIYQWRDGDSISPYLAIVLNLGHLESAVDQNGLLNSLACQNAEIFDPFKVVLENGLVSLSLRTRADLISIEYVKNLLPFMGHFAQQYIGFLEIKYGFAPLLEQADEKKRVLQ